MTVSEFTDLALAFPETERHPHFDRTAFKVIRKRTFATLHSTSLSANIVLTPAQQVEFSELKNPSIFPVQNKWGEKGWTTFELPEIPAEIVQAALELAYQNVMKKSK